MAIIFCHGLESGPNGHKYQALCAAGFVPFAPDFRGMDLASRVRKLLERVASSDEANILIGSSYGGAAAVCAAMMHAAQSGRHIHSLVLCAPALHTPEFPAELRPIRLPVPTSIIHGCRDVVVPLSVSRELAAQNRDVAALVEVDDDHRLHGSIELLLHTVTSHLRNATGATH